MANLYNLPTELHILVFRELATFADSTNLSSSCRLLHDTWLSNAPSISWSIAKRSILCIDEAKSFARIHELVELRDPSIAFRHKGCSPFLASDRMRLYVVNEIAKDAYAAFCRMFAPLLGYEKSGGDMATDAKVPLSLMQPKRRPFSLLSSEQERFYQNFYMTVSFVVVNQENGDMRTGRALEEYSLPDLWRMLEIAEMLRDVRTADFFASHLSDGSIGQTQASIAARLTPGLQMFTSNQAPFQWHTICNDISQAYLVKHRMLLGDLPHDRDPWTSLCPVDGPVPLRRGTRAGPVSIFDCHQARFSKEFESLKLKI